VGKVEDDIKEQLGKFAGKYAPITIMYADVVAINENDTVKVETVGGDEIDDVRLKSVIKAGNKLILTPKIGSTILIGRIESGEDWILISADEVEKVSLLINDLNIEIDENGIMVSKGDDNMKEIFGLIISAVKQIVVLQGNNPDYQKLLNAQSKVDNIFS
jgi:hypothetical protein